MVDLPKHMGIDSTFNISDLYPYTGENVKEVPVAPNSRTSFFLGGENDTVINRQFMASSKISKVCVGKVYY